MSCSQSQSPARHRQQRPESPLQLGWLDRLYRGHQRASAAIEGSSHVVVVEENGRIIGLAHALSDDATMMYIQDILVRSASKQGHWPKPS